jgi:hypothetical protein
VYKKLIFTLIMMGSLFSGLLFAHGDYEEGEKVTISNLKNNAVVTSPVRVLFSAPKLKITAAGVDKHNAGHFHLMVDVDADRQLDEPMQESKNHIRLSNGEQETVLELSLGKHTLQLIVADEEHTHFENLISPKITIYVESQSN